MTAQLTVVLKAVDVDEDGNVDTKARQFILTEITEAKMEEAFKRIAGRLKELGFKEQGATIGARSDVSKD